MPKVLIVDDERSIRETLGEFVRENGHEVFVAGDVEEAIGIVKASIPDVVVSDIVLPGADGIALLDRIDAIAPDIQVIMITGEPTVETAADAVRQGAFDYLAKPVSRAEIQAVVESALRVKRMADERKRLAEENLRYRDHLEEEVERKARDLAASEEKYRTLVENANEAVFVAQDGVFKFANPKTAEVTGYPQARLVSMPLDRLVHPEDRAEVLGNHERRLRGEDAPAAYTFRIRSADGQTRWIEIRPVVVDWEGRPATLNLATDVTARRQAEAALRESEERFRSLFDISPIAMLSVNTEGEIVVCNESFARMHGVEGEPDTLVGRSVSEFMPEGEWPRVREKIEETLREGESMGLQEYTLRREDGSTFPAEADSAPILGRDGRPVGLMSVAVDITERKQAAEALADSETRFRTLFEGSPISLWEEDYSETKALIEEVKQRETEDLEAYLRSHLDVVRDCIERIRVVDVNEATVALHGATSKEDLLGQLSTVIPPEMSSSFVVQLLAIANGEASYEGIGHDRRLDGSWMTVAIRWIAAPGYEESMSRVLVSKVDITATIEAEAALQQALAGTIEAIGLTTEMRDPYTAGHQRRVTALAVAIAEDLECDEDVVEGVRAAGLMHDIGKMAVPAEILSKPSELTEIELTLIRDHPRVAFDILKAVAFPWPLAEIVLQHHERIDGSGYPNGLRGDEIRTEAKILAVADTVEAMASHRPYRPALGVDAALEEIDRNRGTHYDPAIVAACIRLFREQGFTFPYGEGDAGSAA